MTKQKIIETIANSIKDHEGWARPSIRNFWRGSRSFRNKNPGNLRYLAQRGSVGKDRQGFAIFKSYEAGFMALYTDILNKFTGNTKTGLTPRSTIQQFFAVYAPTTDHNDPLNYCRSVLYTLHKHGLTVSMHDTLEHILSLADDHSL